MRSHDIVAKAKKSALAVALLLGFISPVSAASLTLSTNQTQYATGDIVTISGTITPSGDSGVVSDIYVLLVYPDGTTFSLDGNSNWRSGLVPILASYPLATLNATSFYTSPPLTSSQATGVYNLYVFAVDPGTNPITSPVKYGVASTSMTVLASSSTKSVQCGDVLSTANESYKLTTDLNCVGTGITINASGVRLDLHGHTLSGNNTGSGIVVNASNASIVSSANNNLSGTVQHFADGIDLANVSNVEINGITVNNNSNYGIYLSSSNSNSIKASNVKNTGEKGIYLVNSGNNSITGTIISDSGQVWGTDKDFDDGLNIEGSDNNTITGNISPIAEKMASN